MDTLEQLKTKGSSETLKAMEGKDRQAPETFSGVASSLMRQQQKYIADVLTDKPVSIYAMDDYPAIRKQLFNNVLDALDKRFPLYNDKYVLALENVGYDDPEDISIEDQKKAIMEGKSVSRRVRGNWVLKDAATDKVLQRTGRMTLMRVPYMTERGTFIRNGHEYTFNSIMRLEPGVYTKKKNDDEISAQFNIKKGTGAGFSLKFTPSTGVFNVTRMSSNAPAYTVFRDLGVTDEQMKAAWGDELFEKNKLAGSTEKAKLQANKIYNM